MNEDRDVENKSIKGEEGNKNRFNSVKNDKRRDEKYRDVQKHNEKLSDKEISGGEKKQPVVCFMYYLEVSSGYWNH